MDETQAPEATQADPTPAAADPATGSGDASAGRDRDFIEFVVKQIVTDPEAVEVSRSVDDMGVLITLKVSKDDMGKIIGKSGQTAKALRVLLRIVGSRENARVNLKIVEPDGSEVQTGGGEL